MRETYIMAGSEIEYTGSPLADLQTAYASLAKSDRQKSRIIGAQGLACGSVQAKRKGTAPAKHFESILAKEDIDQTVPERVIASSVADAEAALAEGKANEASGGKYAKFLKLQKTDPRAARTYWRENEKAIQEEMKSQDG